MSNNVVVDLNWKWKAIQTDWFVLPFRINPFVASNPILPSEHHVSRQTGKYLRVSLQRVQSGPEPVGNKSVTCRDTGWPWHCLPVGEWRATAGSQLLVVGLESSSSMLCSGSSSLLGELRSKVRPVFQNSKRTLLIRIDGTQQLFLSNLLFTSLFTHVPL